MAKLVWAVFCERAVVDSATNSLTLVNTMEEIHVPKPTPESLKAAAGRPLAVRAGFSIVTNWERTKGDRGNRPLQILLRLLDPHGQKRSEGQQRLEFGKSTRGRAIANLEGLPISIEGRYVWRIYVGAANKSWKSVGEIPYALSFIKSDAELKKLTKSARRSAADMFKS